MLWATWPGDRVALDVRFPASVQTGPGVILASVEMGTVFLSQG